MLTILQDWPSLDTAHIISCTGANRAYPLTTISPQSRVHRNTYVLITTSLSCMKDCRRPLKRLKCSPHQRQRDRSRTMTGKLTPFHRRQVTWSWLKLTTTGGGESWRIGGRRYHTKWSTKLQRVSLPTSWKTSRPDAHESSMEIDFFSLLQQRGLISVWLCRQSGPGASPPP